MARNNYIHIPLRAAIRLVLGYSSRRLHEQLRSVIFIVAYLAVFQLVVLRLPLSQGGRVIGGIGMVIVGLTLFLEGIRLGLIPLGKQVGLKLPERCRSFAGIIPFAFIVGFGATLAEPAIAGLRKIGTTIPAWKAPLLYQMLEQHSGLLLAAIAVGVGAAVILGLIRFYYGLSLKPFIVIIIPLLLMMTIVASLDESLASVIGLAWDAGAVTTGAVTVPLVIAIGLGVSRAVGRNAGEQGGFGTIMLASSLPVAAVMILAFFLNAEAPEPVSQSGFFSPARRAESLKLFDHEDELSRYAFVHGDEEGRRAFYADEKDYQAALRGIAENPAERGAKLGAMVLDEWLQERASEWERDFIEQYRDGEEDTTTTSVVPLSQVVAEESGGAFRVIIPLTFFLLFVMWLLLRQKPRYIDELVLGIILAIAGMTFLTAGIRTGLRPFGDAVGSGLPRAFEAEEEQQKVVVNNFDKDVVLTGITPAGEKRFYFLLQLDDELRKVPYEPDRYDKKNDRYVYVKEHNFIFKAGLSLLGISLVFLFAFGLGYGSTLVEPALHALGETVEDVTVGTIKSSHVTHVVALGVGIGIMIGVGRFMYEIPTAWLLIPPYILLLPLTFISDEEFVGIAWDSGGVTTGPVTVSLVLAMGLGLGDSLALGDCFGILACASVYPIITVMIYGLGIRRRYRRSIRMREDQVYHEN